MPDYIVAMPSGVQLTVQLNADGKTVDVIAPAGYAWEISINPTIADLVDVKLVGVEALATYSQSQYIGSFNNAVRSGFVYPSSFTTPASPTQVTSLLSGPHLLGPIVRGVYIFYIDYYNDKIYRYNTTTQTSISITLSSPWNNPEYGMAVLDDERVLISTGQNPYRFEIINLVTQNRTTLLEMNWQYMWHFTVMGNILVFTLWSEVWDGNPSLDRRYSYYYYDLDGNLLSSWVGNKEEADAFMRYPTCPTIAFGSKAYHTYSSDEVDGDFGAHSETASIFEHNLSSRSTRRIRPKIHSSNTWVFCLTHHPSEEYLYFIGYTNVDGTAGNTYKSLVRMNLSDLSLTILYEVNDPQGANADARPEFIVYSATNVYYIRRNGNIYNVNSPTTVIASVPALTSANYYQVWHFPEYPQGPISNIVDNQNRLWYITGGDVKAVSLTSGDLVVNIDSNLTNPGGGNGYFNIVIAGGKVLIMANSSLVSPSDVLYEVT